MSQVSGIAELVRLMVLRGELAPGQRVIEAQLTQALRTGRSTLREALRSLEARGLLVANHSGGMRVVELDEALLAETLQTRAALEELSAGAAARRRGGGWLSDEDVRELGALAEAADAVIDREAAPVADRAVHLAVSRRSGNRPCHDALDRLWDRVLLAAAWSPDRVVGSRGHVEIVDAIVAGDAEGAAALARRHALADLASRA